MSVGGHEPPRAGSRIRVRAPPSRPRATAVGSRSSFGPIATGGHRGLAALDHRSTPESILGEEPILDVMTVFPATSLVELVREPGDLVGRQVFLTGVLGDPPPRGDGGGSDARRRGTHTIS